MFKKYFLLIFGLVLLADFSISADNDLINNKGCDNRGYFCIFVDNRVKLSGDGSIVAPVKTIKEGQILARQLRREFSKSSIEVYIRGGRYFISEALEFSSDLDSSDFDNSIFYSGFPGEIAVISGGAEITATRKSTEDYFKADVDWKFNQIYSESMSYRNASWPQSGYSKLLNWYSVNNVNAENIDFLGRRIIVKKIICRM